jgi:predicted transposase YbfD/YdcC
VPESDLVFDMGKLRTALHQLTDPRDPRGVRYALVDLLTLLILAKLGGEDTLRGMADWVRLRGSELVRLLHLPRPSLPHQTTYERVLDGLDVEAFERLVGQFFAQQVSAPQTVTLDGKTLRGTIPPGKTQGVHLLAAYRPHQGVVLLQVAVADKTNELGAAPHLVEALELGDCVVTGDAMFAQRDLCERIILAGGEYVFPAKANQAHLQQAIAEVFMPAPVSAGHSQMRLPEAAAHTISAGHGRLEYRYLTVSSQLIAYLDWPHLGQVFRLQRVTQTQKTGKLTYQVAFGITSLSAEECPPARLLHLIRQHWQIENRLHYVRDVTFHEDDCRIRHPRRQRWLASLNNLVIGLIRQWGFPYVPDARRFFAVHYAQALQGLC